MFQQDEQMVYEAFDVVAERCQDHTAIIDKTQIITYSTLKANSDHLRDHLLEAGVRPGDIVAIHLNRSSLFVTGILGILKAHAVYLPIEPNYPLDRKLYMLNHSRATWVITSSDHAEILSSLSNQCNIIKIDQIFDENWSIEKRTAILPRNPKKPTAIVPMYVIYTSGSAGKPKGVIGSQKGLLNRIAWGEKMFPHDEHDVFCQKTAASFVDHIAEIFQALLTGVPLVMIADQDVRDVRKLVNIIHHNQITRITLVPSLLKTMLKLPAESLQFLASLKILICSGESLSKKLAQDCLKKLHHIRLFNIYGSSEVSADVSFYEVDFQAAARIKRLFSINNKNSTEFSLRGFNTADFQNKFRPISIPEHGEEFDSYFSFIKNEIAAHAVDVSSPTFVGHMTSGIPDYFSELSGYLTSLNQNLVKIETSKSFTSLEKQTIGMLHNLFYRNNQKYYDEHLNEPLSCLGIVMNGGTLSNIQALAIARNHALVKSGASIEDIRQEGFNELMVRLGFKDAVIIGSPLMHYSMKKACFAFGMGSKQLVHLELDASRRVKIDHLKKVIDQCEKERRLIIAVIGLAGGTETGTIDPLLQMAQVTRERNHFFHVDAAWGGPFLFSERLKEKLSGIEFADSITVCGHKQLYMPMGTSVVLFKDPRIIANFAVYASYQARKGSTDLGQFSLIGSKPANCAFVHAGLKVLGQSGYRFLLEDGYEKAQFFSKLIQSSDAFQLIGSPDLNIVNYRYLPNSLRHKAKNYDTQDLITLSKANRTIQQYQFENEKTFVSYTDLFSVTHAGTYEGVFRAVFLNPLTSYEDLVTVLNDQLRIAEEVLQEPAQVRLEYPFSNFEVQSVPIGYPIDRTNLYVLDESMKECKIGEVGEIYVGGESVSLGYLHDEALTKERFFLSPFDPSQTLFKTGDFCRQLPNNALEYVGRKDQQIKIRGSRVEIIEVEEAIRSMDGIEDACVITYLNRAEELNLAVYYSMPAHLQNLSLATIRNALQNVLPSYMIPKKITRVDSFPLLPNGKINRHELKKIIEKPVEAEIEANFKHADLVETIAFVFQNFADGSEGCNTPENKKNSVIKILTSIFLDLLEQPSVSLDQNFFDLGADSLMLNKALMKIQEKLAVSIQLVDFFNYPTIEKLAGYIQQANQDQVTPENYFVPQMSDGGRKKFILDNRRQKGKSLNISA